MKRYDPIFGTGYDFTPMIINTNRFAASGPPPSGFPQIVGTPATYNGASSASHAVTLPSGIVSGERLLMIVRQGGSNVSKTPPSGWTALLSGSFMEV